MQVEVYILNTGSNCLVEQGSPLSSFAPKTITDPKTGREFEVLAALVDHELRQLDFKVFYPHKVEFIGLNQTEGRRVYIR
ncbi:MAG: hypothetical protein IJU21_02135, partial [Bacteroidales bacterium]|nr:hypothetical protein [Bacteroidales bacterium]